MNSLARILTCCALCCAVALAGCGDDDAPASDAGVDARAPVDGGAVDEGPRDAGPPDAGPPECVGTPTECATLDSSTCTSVMGCQVTQCVGFAIACEMRSQTECTAGSGTGCTWSGTACEGGAMRCGDVLDAAVCGANTGCLWSTAITCRGAPRACSRLTRDTCTTQPGCTIYVPPFDAGPPMPDAGCGTYDAGTGMVDVDVRVVLGPAPVTPAVGAHVRVESSCGGFEEQDTAVDGTAHFTVSRASGQWDLTAAVVGYTAVSLLDVTNFTITGDVRLDSLTPRPEELSHNVSGTLTGSVGVGNTVQIDAYNFNTLPSAGATWSTQFVANTLSLRQPLTFVALEMDSMGRAVNFATTEVPRTAADITGVALALPSPRVAPTTSTVMVTLPATGGITSADASPVGVFVERLSSLDEGEYVYVGTGQFTTVAGGLQLTWQHFPGATDATLVGATADGTSARLNVYSSDPDATTTIVVGPGTTVLTGTTLSDLEVLLPGASGHDTVAIHLGESPDETPHWRVFGPTLPPVARVPHLPSAVALSDIGIAPDAPLSLITMLIKMESGSAWSTLTSNGGVPGYQYTLGGSYETISSSGR